MLARGKAFRYPSGPAHDPNRKHFCVIAGITPAGDVLLIPICGAIPRGDRTCIIKTGDGWGWITKESMADYGNAKCSALKGLQLALDAKTIELIDVPEQIFRRIINGIGQKDNLNGTIPDFFKEKWLKLK